jgi:hypothetical protein
LVERFLVNTEIVQVGFVDLTQAQIDEFSSIFTAAQSQFNVVRRDKNRLYQPDVIKQSWICFVVLFDGFFARLKLNQNVCWTFPFKTAFDGKKGLIVLDDLTVDAIEITLGIGQIVTCIQDVGFTYAVSTCNGVYSIAKSQRLVAVVLEMVQL